MQYLKYIECDSYVKELAILANNQTPMFDTSLIILS